MSEPPAIRQTAILSIMPPLAEMLPARAPGISARRAHEQLDRWAPTTIRIALGLLERDGAAVSALAPGPHRQPTRFYWRARP